MSDLNLIQMILVVFVAFLAGMEGILDEFQFHQPLVACTLIGLVTGNLEVGIILGGSLQMIALGWANIGAAVAPDAALASVAAAIILVLGGQGKGQQFGELTPFINQYVSQVLFIGEDSQQIEQHLRAAGINDDDVYMHQCQTLEGAFATIQQVTKSSLSQVQAVLLSPACASFDQFSGFAERGKYFSQLVNQLDKAS